MKLFRIVDSKHGAIASVELTGGVKLNSVVKVNEFMRSLGEEQYYGEGVHRLAVALESSGIIFRRLSKLRNGEICAIKIGNVKISDISRWNLKLQVDRDEDILKGLEVNGKIASSPTLLVISDYKEALKGEAFKYAQRSKISFMEAILSSGRLPTTGFKPAYRGGLIVSPADPKKIYDDVISYDIASSYPWSAATTLMPMGSSKTVDMEKLKGMKVVNGRLPLGKDMGFIGRFKVKGLKRKPWVRIPSLKASDEEYAKGALSDRLGLVSCDEITLAMCPQDLRIICIQYDYDEIEVEILEVHRLQRLPKDITAFLGDSFEKKEEASGAARLRAKVAINSVIGLWGTDPFKSGLKEELVDGVFRQRYSRDIESPWMKYAGIEGPGYTSNGRRAWDFRWAVYACAAARLRIVEAEFLLQNAGMEILYCDTDSIKMAGDKDQADAIFEKLNQRAQKLNDHFELPEDMGKWVDESEGYVRTYFRGKKFYATVDSIGNRTAFIAGIYKADADKMIQAVTLDELCDMNTIRINSSRPDYAKIKGDPFGAVYQEVPRALEYTYNRTEMTIAVL